MAKAVPTHPEGWKFAGACGKYQVWHAGKNDYRISDEYGVADLAEQFGQAHVKARQMCARDEWERNQPAHQPEAHYTCY